MEPAPPAKERRALVLYILVANLWTWALWLLSPLEDIMSWVFWILFGAIIGAVASSLLYVRVRCKNFSIRPIDACA